MLKQIVYFKNYYFFRVDGEDVRLMLWDTAGQEEFDAITAAYYRGAHACVLAYSATDRDSFDAIPSWKLKVRSRNAILSTFMTGLPTSDLYLSNKSLFN